ncbi:hypothetical protein DV737_g1415, partial [Chaetothyriales sp. CBS 132003]
MASSTPTELELSPSKARLAASNSLAWTRISSWLTTLFSPAPVPPFEQNPATLAYLQQLMQANLTADQIASMQREVDREQLDIFHGANECTACLVVTTTTPAARALQIGQSIHLLTQQLFTLENQVRELKALSAQLARQSEAAQAAAADLENRLTGPQAEAELERMRLRTAQWARETKQIGLKTEEYERRIAALAQHIEDDERQTRVEAKRSEVRALEQRLRAFHGLPPDVEASRDEVKRAQRELDRWKTKREDMFEQI